MFCLSELIYIDCRKKVGYCLVFLLFLNWDFKLNRWEFYNYVFDFVVIWNFFYVYVIVGSGVFIVIWKICLLFLMKWCDICVINIVFMKFF